MANELYIHTLRQLRDGCKAEHMDTETAALDAAIQALSCDGDCISRTAAINVAIDAINEWGGGWDAEREVRDAINALPSAQIDGDCISRQAAIKEAESWVGLNGYEQHLQRDVVEWLKELPSAQPEIIYCKDCVKHNKWHGYYLDGTVIGIKDCCPLVEIRGMAQGHEFDYQYCAYAERRTDD